ncbi:MAG: LuxR C-terminal-related transcriptional regulator [Dehalococcoidia bacterium]
MGGTLTVALAHPYPLLREGIAGILREASFQVVGLAESAGELRGLAVEHQPDIILVDWEVSDIDQESLRSLAESVPNSSLVVLTQPQPPETLVAAIQAGASGYLTVNLSPEEFVNTLPTIARGHVVIAHEMAGSLKGSLPVETSGEPDDLLSEREREVLGLVGQGATNREIAQGLVVTESTIKAHLRRILNKLNLRNRQQAAVYATREGLIPGEGTEGDEPQDSMLSG